MVRKSLFPRVALVSALIAIFGGASEASQLLSTHASYHQKENFAILVLRFDAKTAHQYTEQQGGMACQITLKNCRIEEKAAADLGAVTNAIIQKIETAKGGSDLTISLRFSRTAKLKLRETENPYSLILDIAPAAKPIAAPPLTPNKKTKSKASKERNRLAQTPAPPQPELNTEADKARQMAAFYDQMGDSSGEAQQWETFFQAVRGGDSLFSSSLAETSSALPGAGREAGVERPAGRPRFPIEWPLLGLVVIFGGVMIILYLRQRELNRAVRALLESPASAESPKSDKIREMKPEPIGEPGRPSDDTAREVLALYRTGMAIPAIAEKMQMGQDEIRLILNLAREEKTTVT